MIKQEHKKELHERVLERCSQLQSMLVALRADEHNAASKRAQAVEEALAALQTHVSGGWDAIDESESAAIARWLETSRFLFDGKSGPAAALVVEWQAQEQEQVQS
jgi:uncharacterized protein YgbK (DUF1537 family)